MRDQVVITVDYLQRRGLRPVVILLDSGSFGGPKGAEKIETAVRAIEIPVRRVVNGDNLEEALNLVSI